MPPFRNQFPRPALEAFLLGQIDFDVALSLQQRLVEESRRATMARSSHIPPGAQMGSRTFGQTGERALEPEHSRAIQPCHGG